MDGRVTSTVRTLGASLAIALGVLFTIHDSAGAAQPPPSVRLFVTDSTGGAVEGATVRVSSADGSPLAEGITDATGRVSLGVGPAGALTVDVSREGFVARRLEFKAPEASAAEVAVTLAVAGFADQVVVTAARELGYRPTVAPATTKSDTPLKETPVSIQVVTRDLIEDRGVQNYGEAVRTVPGISPHIGFGGINFRYTIRGFTAQSNLKNGYRRATFLPIEEIANIEQIEVLKGPASSLYGRFEVGGAVNVVTKRPQWSSAHAVDVSVGRYDFVRTTVDSTGPLGNRFAYRVNAAFEDTDSFRDFVNATTKFVAPAFAYRISDDTHLLIEFEYLDRNGSFDRGFGNNPIFFQAPISRNFGEADTTGDNISTSTVVELNHRINGAWRTRIGVGYSHSTQESFGYNFGFPPVSGATTNMPTVNRRPFYSKETDRTTTALAELYGRLELGGMEHKLLGGVEGSQETAAVDSGRLPNLPIDFLNPVYGNLSTAAFSLLPSDTGDQSLAVFVQDEIRLADTWRLTVGARYDRVETDFFDSEFIGPDRFSRTVSAVSPRAAVSWLPVPQATVYAHYAQSFKTEQNVLLAPGIVPEPSRGQETEVGVKLSLLQNRLTPTLAGFDIRRKNGVVPDPDDPSFRFSLQIGEQRSTGWEVDLPVVLTPQWRLIGSYAHINARVTEGTTVPAGRRLVNAPEDTASTWTTYDWRLGTHTLGFGLGAVHVGDRFGNTANTLVLPAYTRYDTNVSWRTRLAGRDVKLQLNVLNLSDEVYYENGGFTPIYPQAPRTWTLRATLGL